MAYVEIYTKTGCPYARHAKEMLEQHGMSYVERNVSESPRLLSEMRERAGRETSPQVFIDARHIGGSDDLATFLEQEGAGASP